MGVLGTVGIEEECQKAKEGERMKTKKAKKWFMPAEQRWREGFFLYNWLFPSGPRLTG